VKRPPWVPKEPPHTCPEIDDLKKRIIEFSDDVRDRMKEFADELEGLRLANIKLRDWGNDIIDCAKSEIEDLEDRLAKEERK